MKIAEALGETPLEEIETHIMTWIIALAVQHPDPKGRLLELYETVDQSSRKLGLVRAQGEWLH